MEFETFDDVREAIEKKGRPFHLLLGNGFSMAFHEGRDHEERLRATLKHFEAWKGRGP